MSRKPAAKQAAMQTWDYDVWCVLCLICSTDLAVDGQRPGYGETSKHLMEEHGVVYRDCEPTKEGYNTTEVEGPNGTWERTATSIHAADHGRGQEVIMAVRCFGTLKGDH